MVVAAQMRNRRCAAETPFFGIAALAFAVSAAVTAFWCGSMPAMEMRMPGGWTMSMAWMRMPGQTWLEAAASFAGMWTVMMVAMMLPSVTPALWRYREAAGRSQAAMVATGYFAVWSAIGIALFPAGAALAMLEMRYPAVSRAVPVAAGFFVLAAGALQFTAWKAHHLACCRQPGVSCTPARPGNAWRHGLRLGLHCSYACAGLTAILLVFGVMDLGAMCLATVAITAERLAPDGHQVARATGAVALGAGLFLLARVVGLA